MNKNQGTEQINGYSVHVYMYMYKDYYMYIVHVWIDFNAPAESYGFLNSYGVLDFTFKTQNIYHREMV